MAHAQYGKQGTGVTIHPVTTPSHALGSYWCDWSTRSELPVKRMMWRTGLASCESGDRAEHSSTARMRGSWNIEAMAVEFSRSTENVKLRVFFEGFSP